MEKKVPEPGQLYVIARAPFNLYFDGPAAVVSASNRIGDFDVLPNHADFFSILTPGEIAVIPIGETEPTIVPISNGIITVRDNQVMLFVNI